MWYNTDADQGSSRGGFSFKGLHAHSQPHTVVAKAPVMLGSPRAILVGSVGNQCDGGFGVRMEEIRDGSRRRVNCECPTCGTSFDVRLSRLKGKSNVYCSRPCADAAKRLPGIRRPRKEGGSSTQVVVWHTCVGCGKSVLKPAHLPRKYCSRQCAAASKRKEDARWRDTEQIKEYMRQYTERRRAEINKASLEWCRRHPEVRKEVQRRYREAHKAEIRAAERARRAKAPANAFTNAQWEAMKADYEYRCLCCGKREPDIVIEQDHIIPVALGGTHEAGNIQPLCRSCNASKSRKVIDYRKLFMVAYPDVLLRVTLVPRGR